MKNISIIFLFFCFSCSCIAQDLIVTFSNDSIKCQITKSTHRILEYKIDGRDTSISIPFVKEYRFGNFQLPGPDYPYMERERYRIGIYGGITKVPHIKERFVDGYIHYMKDLFIGSHCGILTNFFPSRHFGLGFKYDYFYTDAEIKNAIFSSYPFYAVGDLSESISEHTLLGTISAEEFFYKNKIIANFNVNAGVSFYRDDVVMLNYLFSVLSRGTTLSFDAGLSVPFLKKYTVGFNFSYLYSDFIDFKLIDELGYLGINGFREIHNGHRLEYSLVLRRYIHKRWKKKIIFYE